MRNTNIIQMTDLIPTITAWGSFGFAVRIPQNPHKLTSGIWHLCHNCG